MTQTEVPADAAQALNDQALAALQAIEGKQEQPEQASAEPAPEVSKPQETAAPAEGQAKPDEGDAAYESAKDLEVLGRERVIALGEKESSRSSEFSTKLNDLNNKLKARETATTSKPQEAQQAQPNFDNVVKPLAQAWGDEEVEKPLGVLAQTVYRQAREDSQKEISDLRASLEAVSAQMLDLSVQKSRDRLPEAIRQLADDATLEQSIKPKITALLATGAYESIDDAVRDAAMIVLGPKLHSEAASAQARLSQARANGSTLPLDGRQNQPAKAPLNDRVLAALQALERGEGDDAARSAFNGI